MGGKCAERGDVSKGGPSKGAPMTNGVGENRAPVNSTRQDDDDDEDFNIDDI